MNEVAIRRYERALGKSVRGIRLRKKVKAAFRSFTSDLLEEIDVHDYDVLLAAFGPPEQMAQTLLQSFPELPKPISMKQKICLIIGIFFMFSVAFLGAFLFWNQEETDVYLSNKTDPLEIEELENYVFVTDGVFSQEDIEWNQEADFSSYILLLENTNQTSLKTTVRYSDYRSPHTFELLSGEQVIFRVDDARHCDHTISFDSPDGTFSGTVRVLAF